MQRTLKIIEARLSYKFVTEMFELCNFEDLTLADLPILDVINTKLSDAYNDLPEKNNVLRPQLSQMSLKLAHIYTDLGNTIFQLKNFKDAIEPYQYALKLYQRLMGDQTYYIEKLKIISNLVLAYKNLGEIKEIILLVKDVLLECPTNDYLITLKRDEIFCNFVDCVAIELQKFQVLGLREKIEYLAKDLEFIIYECSEYISESEKAKLKNQLSMLESPYQISEKEVFSFWQHFTFSSLVSPQFFPFSSIKTVDANLSIQSEGSLKNEVIRK
ncbi:MAG: tetratricopeptide repeat protein [Tatlockia sp.]|nr:tetratricopeptide repeat protein [Tatlockia sp.]